MDEFQEFNLDFFMKKVIGTQIQIESANAEGDLGILLNVVVNDAEIKFIDEYYYNGYILVINENISLCFSNWQVSEHDHSILVLYRNIRDNDIFTYVRLLDDNWVDENVVGFVQY